MLGSLSQVELRASARGPWGRNSMIQRKMHGVKKPLSAQVQGVLRSVCGLAISTTLQV